MTGFERTGGHVIVDALARAGATAVFTIHGVQIDPIFQACSDTGVALIDVRHEASAGFAAEAAARVSGCIGAAAVCPGPGFTNVLTSMANARVDRTPVLYLVSSNPDSTQESNGLQVGLDHVAVASPIAKWSAKVATSAHLARLVAQAIRIATTAPCGPVLLDVPADILAGPAVDGSCDYAVVVDTAGVADADVDRCLDLLIAAARPAVLVGHTASAAAREALATFATRSNVPCFLDYRAIGALADDHAAYGGTLYQLARLPPDARPDVILAVGVQFGFDTPGLRDGGVAWGTTIIHVDADPAEVGRFSAGPAGLVADPDQMLAAMAARADRTEWRVPAAWREAVQSARSNTRAELDAIAASDGERLHPYAASRIVSDAVAANGAILIGDGAVCKHWLHDALRLPAGAVYLTHGRFGCMGVGPGLAIGSAITVPGRAVVCVTGDGAMGFSIGEFEAMVRHQLPIIVVVLNNARWGASQGFQMRPGSRQRVVGTNLSDADYHDVMIAFGGRGARVNSVEGLAGALAAAFASGLPTCINVSTNNLGVAPEIPLLNAP
jgi:acetolactate synthase I/II/III large subunit